MFLGSLDIRSREAKEKGIVSLKREERERDNRMRETETGKREKQKRALINPQTRPSDADKPTDETDDNAD
jgi:hypothetical protein